LENVLERALTWFEGHEIKRDDLLLPETTSQSDNAIIISEQSNVLSDQSDKQKQPSTEHDLEAQLFEQERALITQALEATRWNKTAAAKKLGITFRALRYKLKKLGLE
jgi:two-component system response regulator PilR (NtrC family)